MVDVRKIAEEAGFNVYENEIFFNHEHVMTEQIFKIAMLVEQAVISRIPNPKQVLREQQKMLDGVADKLLAQQENPEREKKWLRDQFAMAALQGAIASNSEFNHHQVIRKAYLYADLMLEERDNKD